MKKAVLLAFVLQISLAFAGVAQGQVAAPTSESSTRSQSIKIPVTAGSDAALGLYREAQKLADELHLSEAYAKYEEALAADSGLALAYYGRANSSPTAAAFFENLEKAVARADRVSPAERHMILALQAGATSDPDGQRENLMALVQAYPEDERAYFLLGGYYFGIPDYEQAIQHYKRATEINPRFTTAFNVLGYAYRNAERYDEAESAFKAYTQLLPNEPNPHDSYAELLMKVGRFDESIAEYRKALAADPNFVFSYVGIGNDQMLLGRPAEARATLQEFYDKAKDDGQRRTALFWTAASYVHEGKRDKALETIHKMSAIAEKSGDLVALSGDRILEGNVLLETGASPDDALAQYRRAVEVIQRADAPEQVKKAAERNHLYQEALVALQKEDPATAKAKTEEYRRKVEVERVPFEVQQVHELAGRIALLEGNTDAAVAELKQASWQDPRILWQLYRAYRAKGDDKEARNLAQRAADFNQLNFAHAYVRNEARKALQES